MEIINDEVVSTKIIGSHSFGDLVPVLIRVDNAKGETTTTSTTTTTTTTATTTTSGVVDPVSF